MKSSSRLLVLLIGAGVLAGCSTPVAGQGSIAAPAVSSGPAASSPPNAITVPKSGPALPSTPPSSAAAGSAPGSTPAAASGPAPDGAIGSTGIGDPYYPDSGNGGYQVDNYNISVTYDPASDALSGSTIVTGAVTQTSKLGRFNFDLRPTMKVSAVTVNGATATFSHSGSELIITPATGLQPGSALRVAVTYAGSPGVIVDGTANLGDGGWYRTPSGGALAIGEPFSGSAWYPVNEHPSDPASYQVTATVPSKWSVISNGLPSTTGLPATPAGMKVSRWIQKQPITSYEETLYIDTFTTVTSKTTDGKPIISAFAPGDNLVKDKKLAAATSKVLQVLSNHFGPYPFDSAGGIYSGQKLAFALETATRPVYADWVDLETVIHEQTHQWFGDDVVIKRWSDICLNECFASYGPWLYGQDVDGTDLDAQWTTQMAQVGADPDFWSSPLVDMGAGNEFTSVYSRGPLAIHALRKQMGEKPFAALLKGWPKDYADKPASWDDFQAYVNKLSGQDLTPFMDAWFKGTTVPPAKYLHPGGL